MTTLDDVRAMLRRHLERGRLSQISLARRTGLPQSSLSRFLESKGGLSAASLLALAAEMGYSFQPPAGPRDVCFVDALRAPAAGDLPPPVSEDYLAVPLVGEVGAGPGVLPREEISSWVLVYRGHHSVIRRHDLLAVEIGQNQRSMIPTLHPLDIVLVDRGDWGEQTGHTPPGNIFLVREPGQEGGAMVKRVSLAGSGDLATITFYSDNAAEYGPETYHLAQYESSPRQAIVGRVVWAWADLSRK
ncbi:MAG: XRE family transcriptional regulator [Desulfovibrio sp.]|jgi:transcriptional regulator with XRE-family HTH domain|nr:XRE family transcriptional regulator [Desulfovibrio sp.]